MPGRITTERFPSFYERFAPVAHRRALALLRRDADAWDVVQEVFRRALQATLDFPNEAAALGWVYRVSTNLSLKGLRARQHREPTSADEALAEFALDARTLEARDFVRTLAQQLDDRELEIAVLHLHDGLTQDEIAEVLNVSRKTIVRDVNRIRALARALDPSENGVPRD